MDQIRLVEPPGASAFLVYTENVSKNNAGGLKHRKLSTKEVNHHENQECPQRCFVRLFKCYVSHRPANPIKDNAFYLTPIKNPKTNVWYTSVPVGHNTLSTTMRRLCSQAGVSGYITNHSLRVTAATRLFQKGVDEQLIMARTGHRSTDGIRTYKRVSADQQKALSDILNNPTNEGPEDSPSTAPKKPQESTASDKENSLSTPTVTAPSLPLSAVPVMNFSGCTGNVTINFGPSQQS